MMRRKNKNEVEHPEEPAMHVSETVSGIEVSFSNEHLASVEMNDLTALTSVISLREQLLRKRKIFRAQFRVSGWIAGEPTVTTPTKQPEFKVGKHRVQLFGQNSMDLFDNVLFLLRSHEVRDEFTSVREELNSITTEIAALDKDRHKLEESALRMNGEADHNKSGSWDLHRVLAREKLEPKQRSALQDRRGLNLTISLHNAQAREAFLSRCGSTVSWIRAQQQRYRSREPWENGIVALRADNCRDGGAATTIQHVSLLQASPAESAFFISRDKGTSFHWGLLPDRLFRRMKNAGLDPKDHASNLLYLSTGPMGCYYAEFRSGEIWWGSIEEDKELDTICKEWDVYRAVFGSGSHLSGPNGYQHAITSWIIISRDGRVAWKNIPARLHNSLERRMASEAAPVEAALGFGGSYFVRFMDGTTDYCLPYAAFQACRSIEAQGSSITSMSLHPLMSHDFIIRYR